MFRKFHPLQRLVSSTLFVMLLALPLVAQTPAPELLGWWLFDEEEGVAVLDYSGNENHAEILAPEHVGRVSSEALVPLRAFDDGVQTPTSLWFDGEAVVDDALFGSGVVESMELADQLFEPAFSVSAWICPESLPAYAPIITKVTDVDAWDDGFGIYVENSGLLGAFVNGWPFSGMLLGGSGRVGAWTHVCLTFDGQRAGFYVNGQLRSTAALGNGDVVNDAPVRVGSLAHYPWHGLIGDARVYGSALSANDVFELFSSTPVSEIVDSLGHGIPDVWALRFGLNPWDPAMAGDAPNLDGFTNLQKYRLGLNPTKNAVVSSQPLLRVYTPLEK